MDLQAREKFAQVISELRGTRSYRSFARIIGVSHPTVVAWENVERIPDDESLQKIADLRGESLEEFEAFLRGTREPNEMQRLIQQVHIISDAELAILLRTIAERLEKS